MERGVVSGMRQLMPNGYSFRGSRASPRGRRTPTCRPALTSARSAARASTALPRRCTTATRRPGGRRSRGPLQAARVRREPARSLPGLAVGRDAASLQRARQSALVAQRGAHAASRAQQRRRRAPVRPRGRRRALLRLRPSHVRRGRLSRAAARHAVADRARRADGAPADRGHRTGYGFPDKGMVGSTRSSIPPCSMRPASTRRSARSSTSANGGRDKAPRRAQRPTLPFQSARRGRLARDAHAGAPELAALRPLMSHRCHMPPSAHTDFVAERFVVCTFCPRPLETDPGALKVPFFTATTITTK